MPELKNMFAFLGTEKSEKDMNRGEKIALSAKRVLTDMFGGWSLNMRDTPERQVTFDWNDTNNTQTAGSILVSAEIVTLGIVAAFKPELFLAAYGVNLATNALLGLGREFMDMDWRNTFPDQYKNVKTGGTQ